MSIILLHNSFPFHMLILLYRRTLEIRLICVDFFLWDIASGYKIAFLQIYTHFFLQLCSFGVLFSLQMGLYAKNSKLYPLFQRKKWVQFTRNHILEPLPVFRVLLRPLALHIKAASAYKFPAKGIVGNTLAGQA